MPGQTAVLAILPGRERRKLRPVLSAASRADAEAEPLTTAAGSGLEIGKNSAGSGHGIFETPGAKSVGWKRALRRNRRAEIEFGSSVDHPSSRAGYVIQIHDATSGEQTGGFC